MIPSIAELQSMPRSFQKVDPEQLGESAAVLCARVQERFPNTSLARIANELTEFVQTSAARVKRINAPPPILRSLRHLSVLASIGCCAFFVYVIYGSQQAAVSEPLSLFQGVQAALAIVGIPLTLSFSLRSLADRRMRNQTLKELHNLHGLLNAIDMVQLTKDPAMGDERRTLGRFELVRYLDYCAELLSHIGKVAALHAQATDDPIVVSAVMALEQLAASHTANLWLKIMTIQMPSSS
jgi:hypothetical protein